MSVPLLLESCPRCGGSGLVLVDGRRSRWLPPEETAVEALCARCHGTGTSFAACDVCGQPAVARVDEGLTAVCERCGLDAPEMNACRS